MKKIFLITLGVLWVNVAFAAFAIDTERGRTYPVVGSGSGGGSSGTVSSGLADQAAYYSADGTSVVGQDTLYIDDDNGYVGIGDSTPEYALDVNGAIRTTGTGGLTVNTGGGLRTSTTSTNTALLQAYDTDGIAYTTFGTLTAGPTPTFDLSSSTTIGSDTIVSRTGSQTLTNKTLTTPVIASISNSGTITVPTGTDTLVGRATTDTLTNKTLTSPKIGTSLQATDGTNYFTYSTPGSAVNYLAYANAATGTNPSYTVTGDANRGLDFTMAGTGGLTVTSTNTGPSTFKRGLTVNNDSNNGAGDDFVVKTASSATAFQVDASADQINIAVPIASSRTTDIGWTIQASTNQACNTTCTSACVFGFDVALGGTDLLSCTDATADRCLCAGSS